MGEMGGGGTNLWYLGDKYQFKRNCEYTISVGQKFDASNRELAEDRQSEIWEDRTGHNRTGQGRTVGK